ncbi:MAG TPA: nucleotidyltransferase domain-containing protein [Mucilaginibacter sp.]|jgi:predicted nucleotidyltransferase|nr:nucleotidyltransferase domain-containing protein [Mucilaginibacter sp.]
MNNATNNFLENLKRREDVLGVIMFGSEARGNSRPGSDVDLVAILTEGFRRTVEYHEDQAFEIIYTTAKKALAYWESHIDDAAGLWAVAKVLYDKDGTIGKLKNEIQQVLDKGKEPIDECQLGQFRFDAEDTLKYVGHIADADPTTANLILTNKVFTLTELFFDIRQMWIPAPKQRMEKIKEISPGFYTLLTEFYGDKPLWQRLEIAKKIPPTVFDL